MQPWSEYTSISIPDWLKERQKSFQSITYPDDAMRMSFVLQCAEKNTEFTSGAPLAAAVFTAEGQLLSVGVDAEGIGGHEMTNALIIASNALGSSNFRNSSDWELFSLAPPCLVCLGNIYSERPRRFVCSVSHEDLLAELNLPNTPMPAESWKLDLKNRSIDVVEYLNRERGCEILRAFSSKTLRE